jgi:hypothetical protein
MASKSSIDVEFIEMCLKELERCKSEDDKVVCTYNAITDDPSESEDQKTVKKDIIKFLLVTNQLSELYFIVRSGIMSVINGLILLIAVFFLGSINVLQVIALGILIFFVSLFLSRMLNTEINRGTNLIIRKLNRHEKLKDKLLNSI